MSLPRFYSPQLSQLTSQVGGTWDLSGPEGRHATSVLRLRTGDRLSLFNGQGLEAVAIIVHQHREHVSCQLTGWIESVADLDVDLTLAIALPKGDRQRVLIDALTELGVRRVVPIIAERGVAQPTDKALERLERAVVEACKQSNRNVLMEIAAPCKLSELCRHVSSSAGDTPSMGNESNASNLCVEDRNSCESNCGTMRVESTLRLVAHPYDGAYQRPALVNCLKTDMRRVWLLIGPEGGLTDSEVNDLVAAGWQVADLAQNILRVEIAAMSAAAQILGWYRAQPDALGEKACD